MEQRNSLDPVPWWVPQRGHALRHAGIHFDAVRMIGVLGEQVAYEVMQFTNFDAGPIVRSRIGVRSMYFLVPPLTARGCRWPAGAEAMTRHGSGVAFIGVPALEGSTWPLDWRSRPTALTPFVDVKLLRELTEEVVTREAGATASSRAE
ncbi:hypothetical protein [Streptomyces sp. NBC_00102]|uniref:hypothetical protein n=1 Tax=Streptomyces sp. NBC_00102 TaxID=2975652 RepID=UPI00225AD57A|nr:hypothetical protein [Streptomyces sp. NBC_00102]MCX5397753.1 hypothetical protein [Streptomyces sp. NBC_00102]